MSFPKNYKASKWQIWANYVRRLVFTRTVTNVHLYVRMYVQYVRTYVGIIVCYSYMPFFLFYTVTAITTAIITTMTTTTAITQPTPDSTANGGPG